MSETAKAPVDVFAKVREHDRLEQLEAAKEHDLLPYFRLLTSQAGPVVEMEGRETIMLGSNNYLGLTGDERVKAGARDALEAYGTGVTGSRLLNGTTPLHLDLERELAEWMKAEDAIVFTTGYQSNVGCIGTILGPGDTVICDSGDHASILDGCRLSGAKLRPFRHNRMDKLEKMLDRAASDGGGVGVAQERVRALRVVEAGEGALLHEQARQAVPLLVGPVGPLDGVGLEDLRPLVHPGLELLVGRRCGHLVRLASVAPLRQVEGSAPGPGARSDPGLKRHVLLGEARRAHVHFRAQPEGTGSAAVVGVEDDALALPQHPEHRSVEGAGCQVVLAEIGVGDDHAVPGPGIVRLDDTLQGWLPHGSE